MIGIFSKTLDSGIVEAAGYGGLDFIILDQEHGPSSLEHIHNHVRAAALTKMKTIVRVKELNHNEIGSALDAGADGVQVPNISTVADAEFAIASARFFPKGERGVCRFVKSASYGNMDRTEYFKNENQKLLILQIEGSEGVKNIDEILKIKGFDVLFVGPYDLSQSIGYPGEIDHPEVLKLIDIIKDKTLKSGKTLGTFSDTIENSKKLVGLGFEFLAYSVDMNIFSEACKRIVTNIKK